MHVLWGFFFFYFLFISEKQVSAANVFFSEATAVFNFQSFEDGYVCLQIGSFRI